MNADSGRVQDLLFENEWMGAALSFIFHEQPEWRRRVALYLADYPFIHKPQNDGSEA